MWSSCVFGTNLRIHALTTIGLAACVQGLLEWPTQSYVTSPLKAPAFNITRQGKTEPGYLFLTPSFQLPGVGKDAAAIIVDDEGELIWRAPSDGMTNLRPQMLDGETFLTYWDGVRPTDGAWIGSVVMLDHSYQEIRRVTLSAEEGFQSIPSQQNMPSYVDMHENVITDRGTMLVLANNWTSADLEPVRGPKNGLILDYVVYEIDIATNDVLFRWKAGDHLSFDDTYTQDPVGFREDHPWDYVHLNSVALYSKGYLISSRMYCSVIAIGQNGTMLWRIDGQTGGDFTLGPGTQFCWQHDVRVLYEMEDTMTISMFNNDNIEYDRGTKASTGLILDIHLQNRTVSLNRKVFDNNDRVSSFSQGDCQTLDNNHLFIAYGAIPKIKEFDEHGACVMSAQYGAYNETNTEKDSYRVFRSVWTGRPKTTPSVAGCLLQNRTIVYVSWNGATDVQEWEVYLGMSSRDLHHVRTAPKNGFETRIDLGNWDMGMSQIRVKAVGGPNDGVESQIVSVEDACRS